MLNERELDLKDLLIEMLRHWKGAIICFVIGAICFGVYSYFNVSNVDEADLAASNVPMTAMEKKIVDVTLQYEKQYLQIKELDPDNLEMLVVLNKAVIDNVRGFNESQIEYFKENSQTGLWDKPVSENKSDVATKQIKSINVKITVVGAVLFFIMYLMLWAAKYVLDVHLKNSDNLTDLVNIPFIGRIVEDKKGLILDKKINSLKYRGQRVFNSDRAVEIISSSILAIVKKKGFKSIALIGCDLENKSKKYCGKIAENVKGICNIDVEILNDIMYEKNSMSKLLNIDSVILVETVGNTLFSDLEKEIYMLKQLDINILGYIVVE